jgi:26S proteasome regulatory subunit N1
MRLGMLSINKRPAGAEKLVLADILSVLAMTHSDSGKRETLLYRLVGSPSSTVGSWGHEYVRHLSLEIGQEYANIQAVLAAGDQVGKISVQDLLKLTLDVVPFFMSHNAEADACDLLIELDNLALLPDYVDANTWRRVCLYITSCVMYVAPPEDVAILKTAHKIYRAMEGGQFTEGILLLVDG